MHKVRYKVSTMTNGILSVFKITYTYLENDHACICYPTTFTTFIALLCRGHNGNNLNKSELFLFPYEESSYIITKGLIQGQC